MVAKKSRRTSISRNASASRDDLSAPNDKSVVSTKTDGTNLTSHHEDKHLPGQHRIFNWIKTPVGQEHLEIEDEDLVNNFGVPARVILWHIQQELKDQDAFKSLPFALLLVVVYAVAFLNHDRASHVLNVHDAIEGDLTENAVFAYVSPGVMAHKNLHDVHSVADLHSWLRVGLLPLLFRSEELWSESHTHAPAPLSRPVIAIPKEESFLYLQYNRLIGGMQLNQRKASPTECAYLEVSDRFNLSCMTSARDTFLNLNYQPEEGWIKFGADDEDDPQMRLWFLSSESPEAVARRLQQLEIDKWFDMTTVEAVASFMTYNGHYDFLTLTSVHFFFSRSGHIWKNIVQSTIMLNPYHEIWLLVPDLMFMLLTIWIFVTETRELYRELRRYHERVGLRQAFRNYLQFWNVVDWVSVFAGAAVIALWANYCGHAMGLAETLGDLSVAENTGATVSGSSLTGVNKMQSILNELYERFQDADQNNYIFRVLTSMYPVVLMGRLFKAFDAQPRLALLTSTLRKAFVDVYHFGIVFTAIFLSFAMMGLTLFGREMEEFSNLPRAVTSCFVILMGEFNAVEMWQTGRTLAVIWFTSFQVVIELIMLNMLLAIIMDTYTDVKSHVTGQQTIVQHISTVCRRMNQLRLGQRKSLAYVEHQLAQACQQLCPSATASVNISDLRSIDPEEMFMIQAFQKQVDGLKEPQARRLMMSTVRAWRVEHEEPMGLAEAMHAISHITGLLEDMVSQTDTAGSSMSLGRRTETKPSIERTDTLANIIEMNQISQQEADQDNIEDVKQGFNGGGVGTADVSLEVTPVDSGRDARQGKNDDLKPALANMHEQRLEVIEKRLERLRLEQASRFAVLEENQMQIKSSLSSLEGSHRQIIELLTSKVVNTSVEDAVVPCVTVNRSFCSPPSAALSGTVIKEENDH